MCKRDRRAALQRDTTFTRRSSVDQARSQKIQDDDSVILERKRLARISGNPDDMPPLAGELPIPVDAPKLAQLS